MTINSLIINTLTPLAPTSFLTYSGSVFPHITFFEFNQNGVIFADDEEENTNHSIQVDIWARGDYTNLVSDVKESLKKQGFRRTAETEFYENDSKLYHKVLRFNYVE
jgi:hypothetical protein